MPNQLKQPTTRPTMRWMFQCFEGITLVWFQPQIGPPHAEIAGVEQLHAQVITLLGPTARNSTNLPVEAAKCGRIDHRLVAHPKQSRPGRPRKDQTPEWTEWQIDVAVTVNEVALEREVHRQAAFLVATNVLDPQQLADQELIRTYQEQHSVGRGFSFLKDPLFLASSVFVKKPERIVALSLVMVLCLLVYRLAEHRLRKQLAATGQTISSQVNKPTDRPTMRWVFHCFEGIDLLSIRDGPDPTLAVVLGMQPIHQQVLALLGPSYELFYKSTT